MLRLILARLLAMIPTIAGVALIIFVLFSVIPGSFASALMDDGRGAMDPEVAARMRAALGLDDPLIVRFGRYMRQLMTGDLGTSFRTGEPVARLVGQRIGASLELALAAMGFAMLIGIPLGFYAALRPGSLVDTLAMIGAVSGLSLPKFWLGLMLMYLFAVHLQWLPSFGYGGWRHLVLPALALGVSPLALLARTTRASVLDVINADFVRTARSKGMSETRVVTWHVARNALLLVLTTVGLQFGALMGQAVVVEKLFSWPGLGNLLVESVFQRDIPAVQGSILVLVLFFLVINMLVDIAYVLIDPRIAVQAS